MRSCERIGHRKEEERFGKWMQERLPLEQVSLDPWDPRWSGWTEKLMPSSSGLTICNIDFALYNYKTYDFLLLSHKVKGATWDFPQEQIYKIIHRALRASGQPRLKYGGVGQVCFSNTFFNDGDCFYDGRKVTEAELIDILNIGGRPLGDVPDFGDE